MKAAEYMWEPVKLKVAFRSRDFEILGNIAKT